MDLNKIIESEEFKNSIKEALRSGIDEDYGYDGENEYSFKIFDENFATWCVIEVIKKIIIKNNHKK